MFSYRRQRQREEFGGAGSVGIPSRSSYIAPVGRLRRPFDFPVEGTNGDVPARPRFSPYTTKSGDADTIGTRRLEPGLIPFIRKVGDVPKIGISDYFRARPGIARPGLSPFSLEDIMEMLQRGIIRRR